MSVEDALRVALMERSMKAFLSQIVDRELLRQHAAAEGIAVSEEELQAAADEMRRDRGLENADRTMQWVRAHRQTLESLQESIELLLLRNKVMSGIPETAVERRYRESSTDLESVALFSIRAGTEPEAAALRLRIEAGEQFSTVAASVSLDEATRTLGGFVGRMRRSELAPRIADAVFDAAPGEVVGPIQTEKGYNVFLVADRHTPALDEQRAAIRLILFEELLNGLRQSAVIRYPALDDSLR